MCIFFPHFTENCLLVVQNAKISRFMYIYILCKLLCISYFQWKLSFSGVKCQNINLEAVELFSVLKFCRSRLPRNRPRSLFDRFTLKSFLLKFQKSDSFDCCGLVCYRYIVINGFIYWLIFSILHSIYLFCFIS